MKEENNIYENASNEEKVEPTQASNTINNIGSDPNQTNNEELVLNNNMNVLENVEPKREQNFNSTPNQIPYVESNDSPNPISKPKKKGNKKILIISLLLIIIIGILVFFMYQKINTPKNIFIKNLNKQLNQNERLDNTKKLYEMLENGVNIFADNQVIIKENKEEILNFDFNIDLIDDISNKQQYYNMVLLNKDQEIINLEGLSKDKKLYFKIKDIFDKFYYIEGIEYSNLYNNNYQKLIDNIKNSLNDYFTEDKFVKTNRNLIINKKERNATIITVSLTEKQLSDLAVKMLENIKKDQEVLKMFVTEENSLESITENLEETIKSEKELNKNLSDEVKITYDMYLESNNLLLQEIKIEDYKIRIEGSTSGKIEISQNDTIYAKIDYKEDNMVINFEVEKTKITIDFTFDEKFNKNKVEGEYTIKLSYDQYDVNIDSKVTIDNEVKIDNIDLKNAKSIEKITEDETTIILANLLKHPVIGPILGQIYNQNMNLNNENYYTFS